MNQIENIFSNFLKTKEVQTIHVDEIFNDSHSRDKTELLQDSLDAYRKIIDFSKNLGISEIQIDMQIELIGEVNTISGVPRSLGQLVGLIDDFSMPEIAILIPKKDFWNPRLEIYYCPLPFDISSLPENVSRLYEEYRSLDELKEETEFNKWVVFSYRLSN